MINSLKMNDLDEIIVAIRQSLSNAYGEAIDWDVRGPEREEEESVNYSVQIAFVQTLIFLEAAGLSQIFNSVAKLNTEAKENYAESSRVPKV